ncbi:MAG TPA: hypothetical protein VK966_08065 [Longimicrobiales bacterium]|nr:hypothetical protein [Longimicrobiales bacterium]
MSTKTTAAATADLDTRYGSGTAGGFYVAALTAVSDGAAGTVTEATGGAYARQAINFAAASGRSKVSAADITFPEATTDHGNVVAWGIYDAEEDGNLKHVIELDTPITYNTGYQPVISTGDIGVSEAAYS